MHFTRTIGIFDEYLHYIQHFVEDYGWYIVFSLIAIYLAQPYITQYKQQRSLESANDPDRVSILRRDMQRARDRLKQQQQNEQRQTHTEDNE